MKKLILLIAPLIACALLTFPASASASPPEEQHSGIEPIVINPNDLWQVVVAVSAGIVTLASAGAVITGIVHRAKEPEQKQNERIAALENGFKEMKERLDAGDTHFAADARKMDELEKTMKDTNKVIIEGLQALTAHAIDGNNIDRLKRSDEALHQYLINNL